MLLFFFFFFLFYTSQHQAHSDYWIASYIFFHSCFVDSTDGADEGAFVGVLVLFLKGVVTLEVVVVVVFFEATVDSVEVVAFALLMRGSLEVAEVVASIFLLTEVAFVEGESGARQYIQQRVLVNQNAIPDALAGAVLRSVGGLISDLADYNKNTSETEKKRINRQQPFFTVATAAF